MSVSVSECPATRASLVMLKGGLTVPLAALQLAWLLEDRGAVFLVEGGDLIVDGPAGFLTDGDRAQIRRWREHLKAIASYQAPEAVG